MKDKKEFNTETVNTEDMATKVEEVAIQTENATEQVKATVDAATENTALAEVVEAAKEEPTAEAAKVAKAEMTGAAKTEVAEATTDEAKSETTDAATSVAKAEMADVAKAEKKSGGWGKKTVTRTFAIIALAATIVINAACTAGIMALFSKNDSNNMQDMPGRGGPGSEMFSDDGQGNNKMMPPGNGQSGDQQNSSKASIGIVIREDSGAVYVVDVTGDNAKSAGFEKDDKIVSIDGKEVSSSNDLINEVQSHKAGDTVTVTVERNGKSVELKTELE